MTEICNKVFAGVHSLKKIKDFFLPLYKSDPSKIFDNAILYVL